MSPSCKWIFGGELGRGFGLILVRFTNVKMDILCYCVFLPAEGKTIFVHLNRIIRDSHGTVPELSWRS